MKELDDEYMLYWYFRIIIVLKKNIYFNLREKKKDARELIVKVFINKNI
jgi:hypothetical protein